MTTTISVSNNKRFANIIWNLTQHEHPLTGTKRIQAIQNAAIQIERMNIVPRNEICGLLGRAVGVPTDRIVRSALSDEYKRK